MDSGKNVVEPVFYLHTNKAIQITSVSSIIGNN